MFAIYILSLMKRTVLYIPFDFDTRARTRRRHSPSEIEKDVMRDIAKELHPPLNHSS